MQVASKKEPQTEATRSDEMPKIECPSWLKNEDAKALFFEYVNQLVEWQIFMPCDVHLLAAMSMHQIHFMQAQEQLTNEGLTQPSGRGGEKKNAAWTIQRQALDAWLQIAGRFGFTPASREKITIVQKGTVKNRHKTTSFR